MVVKQQIKTDAPKHGLQIPMNAENYEMFVTQMKASEREFRKIFAAGWHEGERETGDGLCE